MPCVFAENTTNHRMPVSTSTCRLTHLCAVKGGYCKSLNNLALLKIHIAAIHIALRVPDTDMAFALIPALGRFSALVLRIDTRGNCACLIFIQGRFLHAGGTIRIVKLCHCPHLIMQSPFFAFGCLDICRGRI